MAAVTELFRELVRGPRREFNRAVVLLSLTAIIVVCLTILLG